MGAFFAREDACDDVIDGEPRGNYLRRARIVTCEHDGRETHRLHLSNCCGAGRLLRIADAEETDSAILTHDGESRLAAFCHIGECRRDLLRERDVQLRQKSGVARRTVCAADARTYAPAEHRLKIRGSGNGKRFSLRIGADGSGNGMLAARLECGRQRDELVRRDADGADADELRATLGERARLVHKDGVNISRRLERCARLDEDAVRRASARADHDCNGRCEAECAGAGDDEDGDRDGEGELNARAHHEPDAARQEGERDHDGDKDR